MADEISIPMTNPFPQLVERLPEMEERRLLLFALQADRVETDLVICSLKFMEDIQIYRDLDVQIVGLCPVRETLLVDIARKRKIPIHLLGLRGDSTSSAVEMPLSPQEWDHALQEFVTDMAGSALLLDEKHRVFTHFEDFDPVLLSERVKEVLFDPEMDWITYSSGLEPVLVQEGYYIQRRREGAVRDYWNLALPRMLVEAEARDAAGKGKKGAKGAKRKQEEEGSKKRREKLEEELLQLQGELREEGGVLEPDKLDRIEAVKRELYPVEDRGAADRIGLAFSGGGIRSASFNIGIMQALSKFGALPWVDYLTSVSGGGFAATLLETLLAGKRRVQDYFFSSHWEQFPLNPLKKIFDPANVPPDEVNPRRNYQDVSFEAGGNNQFAHLRDKGNYLVPRLGWATRDVLRSVGGALGGIGFTILIYLLALLVLSSAHYLGTAALSPVVLKDIDTRALPAPPAEPDEEAQGLESTPGEVGGRYNPLFLLLGDYETDPNYVGEDNTQDAQPVLKTPWLQYSLAFLLGFLFSWGMFKILASLYHYKNLRNWMKRKVRLRHLYVIYVTLIALTVLLGIGLIFFNSAFRESFAWLYFLLILTPFPLFAILTGLNEFGYLNVNRRWIGVVGFVLALYGLFLVATGGGVRILQGTPSAQFFGIWLPILLIVLILGLNMLVNRLRESEWDGEGLGRQEHIDELVLRLITGALLASILFSIALIRTVFLVLEGMAGSLHPFLTSSLNLDLSGPQIYWIFTPVLFMLGSITAVGFVRFFQTKKSGVTWNNSDFLSIFWAFSGLNVYALVGALVLSILVVPQFFAVAGTEGSPSTIPLATVIISAVWAAFISFVQGTQGYQPGSLLARIFALPEGLRNFVLGLLVLVINLSLIFIFESLLDRTLSSPLSVFGVLIAAVGLFLLVGGLVNFNYLSPHYFFRERMADAFMKTELETRSGRVVYARDDSKVRLQDVNPLGCSAPYHLVMAAINLPGSWHLKYKDRKSQHFIFSKDYCGSDVTGYVKTDKYRWGVAQEKRGEEIKITRFGKTKYARTIALSGAATSSGLGYITFFAQAFIMTLLNVRLGLWMVNPERYAPGERRQAESDAQSDPNLEFESRAFWPLYLLDEALAKISERRPLVNITDGGHTGDNTALYPLFQRRCKVIIAGDASQDPQGHCNDLFRVIHHIKVDLGIEVEINIDCLQPLDEDVDDLKKGWSHRHVTVGRIIYPPDPKRGLPEERGWLVYLKPTITGDEPAEIKQFWQTHPGGFPHPTTVDQFFDELQFEAQRFLGELTVEHTLEELVNYYQGLIDEISEQVEEIEREIREIELQSESDKAKREERIKEENETLYGLSSTMDMYKGLQGIVKDVLDRNPDYPALKDNFHFLMGDLQKAMNRVG